jgi:transcriptional regulator with XRE-family HTH domain
MMRYEDLRRLVARRARKLRDAKEWNQRQMERASGVSQKAISNVEATDSSIQLDTLAAIAGAFGVEVWELLKPGPDDMVKDHNGTYEVDPRAAIRKDGPPGLRELVMDEGTTATLGITPAEWRLLAEIGAALPLTVDKAGFVQLLFTLRTISK